ncbi:MAG: HEPN domain-containing protein, partial [Blastocatellia bacterium]
PWLILPAYSFENCCNLSVLRANLKYLSGFSVDIRYPDATATKTDARKAIKICRDVRKVIRTAFGLPV